jgi:hypothetical protein
LSRTEGKLFRNEELGISNEKWEDCCMKEFIEQRIIAAVRGLLTGRVNEILRDEEFNTPIIEFGDYGCGYAVSPVIALALCEKSEKERIIKIDAYSLTITFTLPETFETESQCYAYAGAVCTALKENPTLGGVVDRATITGEKYAPPKKANCGQNWEVVINLRVTVEGIGNAG